MRGKKIQEGLALRAAIISALAGLPGKRFKQAHGCRVPIFLQNALTRFRGNSIHARNIVSAFPLAAWQEQPGDDNMMKLIFAGVCALALTGTGALAQVNQGQGGQPTTKSGGVAPGADHMKKKGTGNTVGNSSGASDRDRATVPGSLNAGGTSQSAPNTTQPGASKTGGNN